MHRAVCIINIYPLSILTIFSRIRLNANNFTLDCAGMNNGTQFDGKMFYLSENEHHIAPCAYE